MIILLYDSQEQSKTEVYLITKIKYLFFKIIVPSNPGECWTNFQFVIFAVIAAVVATLWKPALIIKWLLRYKRDSCIFFFWDKSSFILLFAWIKMQNAIAVEPQWLELRKT